MDLPLRGVHSPQRGAKAAEETNMWNPSWMQSLPAVALPLRDAGGIDAALDLAVWFAACAALGAALSWLRALARRRHHDVPTGPRLIRALGTRGGTLVRA